MKFLYRAGVACLTGGILLLTSCSSVEEDTRGSGVTHEAEIDWSTSRVILPADSLVFSEYEQTILSSAASVGLSVCAKEKLGIIWVADRVDPEEEKVEAMKSIFGPWTEDMAAKYAFIPPMTTGEMRAKEIIPDERSEEEKIGAYNDHLSEAEKEKVFATCLGYAPREEFDESKLGFYDGEGQKELVNTYEKLVQDPRVIRIHQELSVCYAQMGLTIKENKEGFLSFDVEGSGPFTEEGEDINPYRLDEEQITLALKVVKCKEKVKLVPRVARVWAELQAPIIEEYAEELIAQREKIDQAVSKAKKYIADHPEAFEYPAQQKARN